MACVTGTNIVNDGLVFHFDLENGVKSFKGKPTSNIINSQTISGVSPLVLTEISNEDGWSKYSISGTWNRGTYPWGMRIGSASLAGGVFHSARMLIKINCRNKFATWVNNGGLHYVNESGMPSSGTRSAISLGYDNDGLEVFEVKNDGFQYSTTYANPTTTQVGYFHSRPLSDGTTFDPQTDFVWVKEIQVEVGEFATKFVNGIRLDTASIIDVSPTQSTITAANLTYRQDDTPTFDGTNDKLSVSHATLNHPASSYTSEAWIKMEAAQSNLYPRIWDKATILVHLSQTSPFAVAQNTQTSAGLRQVAVGAAFNNNIWTHIVTSYDGKIGKIYINGNLLISNDFGSILNPVSSTTDLGIGGGATYTGREFNGEIDQVRLYWDRVLTDAEVRQNFEATRTRYGI